jgi:hypothetical protein
MELHFPMPVTIRCFKCGKVFEVAFTSEERHEFPCALLVARLRFMIWER